MNKNNIILKIKKNNLIKNYNFFKKRKKNLIVASTIKANAYGLGDKKIFEILYGAGCKHFFVATIEEGIKISKINKKVKIYILNGIQNYDYKIFNRRNLIPIINSIKELKKIGNKKLNFGIHIDTGINRLGISHNDIKKYIYKLKVNIVISHLASAE